MVIKLNENTQDTVRVDTGKDIHYEYYTGYCPELDITVLMRDTYSKNVPSYDDTVTMPNSTELVSFAYGNNSVDDLLEEFDKGYQQRFNKDALTAYYK